MKNQLIPAITLLVILTLVYFQHKSNQSLKRQLANSEQLASRNNAKIFRLTKREFKRSDSLLKTKLDSLGLKFRHIERTFTHNYNHSYDTTIRIEAVPGEPIKRFEYNPDNCIDIKGFVDTFADTMIFSTFNVDISSETYYYWHRPKKFWFIKYGEKQHFAKTVNNCSGETETVQIDIVED